MRQETIYIKGEQNVEVQHPDVTLGDIVQFECSNPEVLPKLRTLKIMKFKEKKRPSVCDFHFEDHGMYS